MTREQGRRDINTSLGSPQEPSLEVNEEEAFGELCAWLEQQALSQPDNVGSDDALTGKKDVIPGFGGLSIVKDPALSHPIFQYSRKAPLPSASMLNVQSDDPFTDGAPQNPFADPSATYNLPQMNESLDPVTAYILLLAKEAKVRGLLIKTKWSWKEVQEGYFGGLGKDAWKPGTAVPFMYNPGKTAQDYLAGWNDTSEQDANRKLIKANDWMARHAEARLRLQLREQGVPVEMIGAMVDDKGKPDLVQMISKIWHIQNPEPPHIKVFIASMTEFKETEVFALHLNLDATYDEFLQALDEIAPFPSHYSDDESWEEQELAKYEKEVLGSSADDMSSLESMMHTSTEACQITSKNENLKAAGASTERDNLLWTFFLVGHAQIDELLTLCADKSSHTNESLRSGIVWRLQAEGDFNFMKMEMAKKHSPTPVAFLIHEYHLHHTKRRSEKQAAREAWPPGGDLKDEAGQPYFDQNVSAKDVFYRLSDEQRRLN